MTKTYEKWVACFGNAISYKDQKEVTFTKDLTLRYPVRMVFSGNKIRIHFSNLTGTEAVTFKANIARSDSKRGIDAGTIVPLTYKGNETIVLEAGERILTDEAEIEVTAGEWLSVSLFLDGYNQMNSGVLITGCLSKGYYSYGNFSREESLPIDLTRNTDWYYFLETIDICTEEKNHALVCYGDSITAQDWPDNLAKRAWDNGFHNIAIIRRAVSGTRVLRQYDCITYKSYGLKGSVRFPIESDTAGADILILQHGINDIIHPVGTDVNIFRPKSDLPSVEELEEGFRTLYVEPARERGYQVWSATLLPIEGWRTYAPFRDEIKDAFNEWLRTSNLFDGCVDFAKAVEDPFDCEAFKEEYDSGDHLHPSALGYQRMAEEVPEELLK